MSKRSNFPEPVPPASQLTVLPFLSAVHGLLAGDTENANLRITMHRVMSREGQGYLQQTCTYFGLTSYDQTKVGRMFTVDTGIMGAAFDKSKIQRTRHYQKITDLQADLRQDLKELGKEDEFDKIPLSYLAVPLLGPGNKAVLILYAECNLLNFFANDNRLSQLTGMCNGFCRLIDWLNTEQPFDTLRNYPLEMEKLAYDRPTVFRRLQESVDLEPPCFKSVTSVNFDVSIG